MVDLKHTHELILGLDRDPIFGPIVMFGAGGTAVEVIADSAVMLPPLDLLLARDLIGQTRISRLLEGYRDRPAADIDAVAAALVRLSALAAMCPAIVSLDINPLVAGPDGAVALDARITIDPDRIAIPGPNPDFAIAPYPAHLATRLTTRAGVAVEVRPIRPEDEALYPPFIEKLEQRDVRLRFLAPRKVWSHAMLARLTQIDYDREMAFVALDPETGELLAVARLHADPDRIEAEYAVLVRSDKHGIGLGWTIMQHLIDYARETGVGTLYGDVLAENEEMLAMCRQLGFTVDRNPEMTDMFIVRLALG
jgi:acetyltransferase